MAHHESYVFHRLECQFHVHSSGTHSVWEFLEPQNHGGLATEACSSKFRSRPISSGSFQGQNCWLKEYGIKMKQFKERLTHLACQTAVLRKKIAVPKKIIKYGRGNWPPWHPWTAVLPFSGINSVTKASSSKLIYCSICGSLYKGLLHFNKLRPLNILVLMIDSSYQVQQQLGLQSEQWVQQEYLAVLVP